MRERREYVRANGLVLINYKSQQVEGKSSAFDASGAGVRIIVDRKLKIGSEVELEIYLPGDSQPVKAKGKVAWAEKCKEKLATQFEQKKEYFYTGIDFTVIDENSRTKIAGYVYRKLR
jgi:c-di-GMP-binding flagellar brake protein YcgR